MVNTIWFFACGAAIAILVFGLLRQFADDRLDAFTERLRGSSRLVSRGELVDGHRHTEVAMALTDSSFLYESADGQSSFDRQWIRNVEYESPIMRLRCFSRTFEFVLSPSVIRQWESLLPRT